MPIKQHELVTKERLKRFAALVKKHGIEQASEIMALSFPLFEDLGVFEAEREECDWLASLAPLSAADLERFCCWIEAAGTDAGSREALRAAVAGAPGASPRLTLLVDHVRTHDGPLYDRVAAALEREPESLADGTDLHFEALRQLEQELEVGEDDVDEAAVTELELQLARDADAADLAALAAQVRRDPPRHHQRLSRQAHRLTRATSSRSRRREQAALRRAIRMARAD